MDMDMGNDEGGMPGHSFASLQPARDKTQRKVKLALQIFFKQTIFRHGAGAGDEL